MPAISKIRLTNIVYEDGNKRYNDELFLFDGHNGSILLENGGGKTVLIQTALQAVFPHVEMAGRKIKNTLLLENTPAHIAIEWIDHDQPRRYVVTAVTLFLTKNGLDSLRYVYEYNADDPNGIEGIPFVRDGKEGKRPAGKGEMQDYYSSMKEKSSIYARTFATIKEYRSFIEKQYHIIASEWESIVKINSTEGGVEAFFDECKSTNQLFDRLLIPAVEDSIAGHDKDMFADMFEKQYQSFKNYKKLKETIDENKRIQGKLEQYVMFFENLHHEEQAYLKKQQQVKGVWSLTLLRKQQLNDELAEVSQMRKKWEADQNQYKIERASYDIAVEQAELDERQTAYDSLNASLQDKEEMLDDQQKELYSLKLAKMKQELKIEEESQRFAEKELAALDRNVEYEDLKNDLELTRQSLLGCYLKQIEKMDGEMTGLQYELQPILRQMEQIKQEEDGCRDSIGSIKEQLSAVKATIQVKEEDMTRIKKQILANPQQEQVLQELKKWEKRRNLLDEENVLLNQQVKQLIEEQQDNETKKAALSHEQKSVAADERQTEVQLNGLHLERENVIKRLTDLRPQWANTEDIYSIQQTIETRLFDQIEKLKKERDMRLYEERLAYRFVDDYQEQDLFFSDPYVDKQLAAWKNQLDYVVTGVEYVQNLSDEALQHAAEFPLWPLTLVTTNKSKQRLMDKLKQITDRLSFPVIVLTTEEALQINDSRVQAMIAPRHWNNNMDKEQFLNWKNQLKEDAHTITESRKLKEQELTEWEDGWKLFHQYLEKFPYEKYTQLRTKQSEIKNKLEELTIQMDKTVLKLEDIHVSIADTHAKIANHKDEMTGLDGRIREGHQYRSCKQAAAGLIEKKNSLNEDLQQLEKDLLRKQKEMQKYDQQKGELQDRIGNLETEIKIVKNEDDYKAVQSLQAVYTNTSKHIVKEQMHHLQQRMNKIETTHNEWTAKRDGAIKAADNLLASMNGIRSEHEDLELDEDLQFPSDGLQWMEDLKGKLRIIKGELHHLNKEVKAASSKKDQQKGKYDSKIDQFKVNFPENEVTHFDQPLAVIVNQLNQEKDKLNKRNVFIDQQYQQFQKLADQIAAAERKLEQYMESHHFNAPDIKEMSLTDEQRIEFDYQPVSYAKARTAEMKNAQEAVKEVMTQVEREKNQIKEFCRKEISDIKLQQMAINGIEHKQTFHDVISFKNNMFTSIDRISKYANEHIRQSDEDLQLFINQIHTHLKNIAAELKQIPNKTKVKEYDNWKQIFTFSIPEWEEEIGKTRIRDHVEWILQQLESERFINDQGLTDEAKVRKDVERWLQTKSLLQIIMNSEVMKVNLRKVMNDNKVTSRSYSWEQSNVWSGGEKWSKNMTLFLGILNYVAEKKQHLQSDMKRHRAVILDNPFGKASSDHVLSPVFFVAEQLGFQIIALTAHAEGKFLQDYFPVIYSCRLRVSQDPAKKVMTKEKWLHHAYFQDHEPIAIERLGEVKQMELF